MRQTTGRSSASLRCSRTTSERRARAACAIEPTPSASAASMKLPTYATASPAPETPCGAGASRRRREHEVADIGAAIARAVDAERLGGGDDRHMRRAEEVVVLQR